VADEDGHEREVVGGEASPVGSISADAADPAILDLDVEAHAAGMRVDVWTIDEVYGLLSRRRVRASRRPPVSLSSPTVLAGL